MTDTIFAKYAALRDKYPDDIATIEKEETRVSALLKKKEYAQLEITKELIALCRKDIVWARKKLATERHLEDTAVNDLWTIIDGRTWVLQQLAVDFDAELALISSELDSELAR
jgi:hypothetical protein